MWPGLTRARRNPVWSIAPESVIVSPAPDQQIQRGTEVEIWGRAWADKSIDRVDISCGEESGWTIRNPRASQGTRLAAIFVTVVAQDRPVQRP